MFELVFLSGARAGEVVQVTKTLLAGRSPECSLEVPDPNASRQHARFVFDGTALSLADNRSANGTFLTTAGQPEAKSTQPVVLKDGDVVRMGETRIRVQVRAVRQAIDPASSSIFSFRDTEADISQSIMMSASDVPGRALSPAVIQARLQAIVKVSKLLVDIAKLDQVLDGVLGILFDVFPQADRGFLMLGKEVAKLEPKAVRQRDGKPPAEGLMLSTTICRRALEAKQAFVFSDQNAAGFDQGMSIVSLNIRSAMTIPLMVNEEVLGLLQIDTADRARAFTADDLELAVAVSQQAAIAVHNALLLKKIEQETQTRTNLCRFLPGPLVEQAVTGAIDLNLGGKTCTGTILFSDVVGFTRLSESLHPEAVVKMMNDYFDRMVPAIKSQNGAIDKFIGDAIMAFWGVPFDKGSHALDACQAALAMQNGLIGFNSLQRKEGKPELANGIGINSGMVVAGNIGSSDSISYTLLGDTVNTASRIEHSACRSQVLVSEATWKELKGAGCGVRVPPFSARNKAEPLITYCLRGLRVEGGEVVLHLVCRSGMATVWLVRRLSDGTFVCLHPAGHDICAQPLESQVVEWPGSDLGRPEMVAALPPQGSDGVLARCQIRLPDADLKGLLGGDALPCALGWDQMVR